jgi:HEAT repeat protein
MNNSLKIGVLLIVIVLSGTAFWYFSKNKKPLNPNESFEAMLENDRFNLTNKDATEPEIQVALLRLSREKDPAALTGAKYHLRSPNQTVRAAAVEALGYYEGEEVEALLAEALKSEEKVIRHSAIKGLAHLNNNSRKRLLEEYLQQTNVTEQERISVYDGLGRMATGEDKSAIVKKLVAIANSSDSPESNDAAFRAASMDPEGEDVRKMFRAKVLAGRNETVMAVGIRHLAGIKDPWIGENLKTVLRHPKSEIRQAVVQTFHELCPANRWVVIERIFVEDKDQAVLKKTVEETGLLHEDEGTQLLEKIYENKKVPEEILQVIQETLVKLKQPGQGPCFSAK